MLQNFTEVGRQAWQVPCPFHVRTCPHQERLPDLDSHRPKRVGAQQAVERFMQVSVGLHEDVRGQTDECFYPRNNSRRGHGRSF